MNAWIVWAGLGLAGCDGEDRTPHLLDLAGPEGRVLAPGPWPVEVLSRAASPVLHFAADGEPAVAVPLVARGADRFQGEIRDLPVGSWGRYHVTAGGDRLPPSSSRAFEVVAAPAPDAGPQVGGPCALRFRAPVDGDVLGEADDVAPQAGLQVRVVVETDLAADTPARLGIAERGYVEAATGGLVTFPAVDLAPGLHALVVEARNPGGPTCAAEVTVQVSDRAAPTP